MCILIILCVLFLERVGNCIVDLTPPLYLHSSIDQTTQESRLTETKVNAMKDRKVCGDDNKF